MDFCVLCGQPGSLEKDFCSICLARESSLPARDRSIEYARVLSGTGIPDMVAKGVKYRLEPQHLGAIQDIIVSVKGFEQDTGRNMASARMYHLLGNFFSAIGNQREALVNYQKASEITPSNLLTIREKIRVLEGLGRDGDARAEKAKMLNIQQMPGDTGPTGKPLPPSPPPGRGPSSPPPGPPGEAKDSRGSSEIPVHSDMPPSDSMRRTPPLPPSPPPPRRGDSPFPASPPDIPTGNLEMQPPSRGGEAPGPILPIKEPLLESGPYSSNVLPPEEPTAYGAGSQPESPPPLPHSPDAPTVTQVKQRVQEVFLWIGKLNPAGISTEPALNLLQDVQLTLTSSDTGSAMKSADRALEWCKSTMRDHAEKCSFELSEVEELISEAAEEGIPVDEPRREMEYASSSLGNENFADFSARIGTIRTHIDNYRKMRRFNLLLKGFSERLSVSKNIMGDIEPIPRLDEIMRIAVESLVANRFDELEGHLDKGIAILDSIEGIEELVKELPGFREQVTMVEDTGGSVDEVQRELILAMEALGSDRDAFVAHFENSRGILGREGERLRERRLARQLDELTGEIGRMSELEVDVSIPLGLADGITDLLKEKQYVKADDELQALNGAILNCYTAELAKIGDLLDQAQARNLTIPGIEEHLSLAVKAWNEQDRSTLYEELKFIKATVSESIEKGNYDIVLGELLADFKRYGERLGDNKATRHIGELLGQATGMVGSGASSRQLKEFFTELRSKMDELRGMAEVVDEIILLRDEVARADLPEEAAKAPLRELSIAERVLDTNLGFATNYVSTAREMIEELKGKYLEERLENQIIRCGDTLRELTEKGADVSFATLLYDKVVDLKGKNRSEEQQVLLEKLEEDLSEIKRGLYSDIARDRVIMLQTKMAEHSQDGLDLSDLNELLSTAINEMQSEHLEKAMGLLDECENILVDRVRYRETIETLKSIRHDLTELEEQGVNISKVEKILLLARPELEKGNYDGVMSYSDQCRATMKECYQQKEFLDILEHLYNEIEEARSARIDVSAAKVLAETSKNDIMDFNFLKAKDSIDKAREMIRRSVVEFHDLTELVRLSKQKIDETRAIGADVSSLDELFGEMMELATAGKYSDAKSKAKMIVEKSLSTQLSFISETRSRHPVPGPPPPAVQPDPTAIVRSQAVPEPELPPPIVPEEAPVPSPQPTSDGGDEEDITDLLADIRNLYQKGVPPTQQVNVTPTMPLPAQVQQSMPSNRQTPVHAPARAISPGYANPMTQQVIQQGQYQGNPMAQRQLRPQGQQQGNPMAQQQITPRSQQAPAAATPSAETLPGSDTSGNLLDEIRNIYSRLDSSSMTCPYCSRAIPRDSTFCSQCGRTLK